MRNILHPDLIFLLDLISCYIDDERKLEHNEYTRLCASRSLNTPIIVSIDNPFTYTFSPSLRPIET